MLSRYLSGLVARNPYQMRGHNWSTESKLVKVQTNTANNQWTERV